MTRAAQDEIGEPRPAIASQPESVVVRATPRAVHLQKLLFAIAAALVASASVGWYASRAANGGAGVDRGPRSSATPEFHLPPLAWTPPHPVPLATPVAGGEADLPADEADGRRTAATERPASAPSQYPRPPALVSRQPNDDEAPVLWRSHDDRVAAPAPDGLSQHPATGLLTPGYTPVRATQLPSSTQTLIKGTAVGCTLESAIESQLTGLVSCLIGTAVYGADGQKVLLPRGTRLLGEARSEAKSGQSRIYVLWIEARTPGGVLVPLASPATDALGRAGVPGEVDTHFFSRFGAAMLISVVDGAVQAAVSRQGSGTVVVTPQSSEAILTEVLRNTIAIPPTISVQPGSHLTVLVVRDVDFAEALSTDAPR